MMKYPSYVPLSRNLSEQTIEQTKVIQEVASPGLSKLNDAVMNKKQGDRMQFSPEKRPEKRILIHQSCQLSPGNSDLFASAKKMPTQNSFSCIYVGKMLICIGNFFFT